MSKVVLWDIEIKGNVVEGKFQLPIPVEYDKIVARFDNGRINDIEEDEEVLDWYNEFISGFAFDIIESRYPGSNGGFNFEYEIVD